jgi:glycosyltransferase involved in cell wall biosynthesis
VRILIVTPLQPQATGNLVTARRHQQGLLRLGHEALLTMTEADDPAPLRQALREARPDLVHLLHAWRCGRPWLACRAEQAPPYVVTLTGTDVHHDLRHPDREAVVREVLARAAAIISQNRLTCAELEHSRPEWGGRLRYLPPGVLLGATPFPLSRRYGIPADRLLFLHPAGIRPVKGNLELLDLFDRVAALRSDFLVLFSGPVLDEAYAGRFLNALAARPWALYLDVIPPVAMAAALREADVVLNHSTSEGLPNTLVEAAALGRPMLVRDIPGNAAVVTGGENGLLYGSDEEFVAAALRLLDDPALRRALAHPAPERFSPEREAEALAAICREALGRS